MRPALSTDESSGSTRFQADDEISEALAHDVTFHELLGVTHSEYERQDVATPKPAPCAEVSWQQARPTADVLRGASDAALAIEAYRRGMRLVGAKNILSGRYASGKKPHRRKQNKSK